MFQVTTEHVQIFAKVYEFPRCLVIKTNSNQSLLYYTFVDCTITQVRDISATWVSCLKCSRHLTLSYILLVSHLSGAVEICYGLLCIYRLHLAKIHMGFTFSSVWQYRQKAMLYFFSKVTMDWMCLSDTAI